MIHKPFVKLIDLLVPGGYLELGQYDVILRARVTVTILCLSIFMCSVVGMAFPHLDIFSADVIEFSAINMSIAITLFTLTLLIFRLSGSFTLAANMYATTAFCALAFESATIGGAIDNPLTLFILIVPMFVFLITGKYQGLFWTAVVILYYNLAPSFMPDDAVSHIPEETSRFYHILASSCVALCIYATIYLYDSMNDKLRHVISEERNHYAFEAGHDKLTGLLNRASFQQRIEQCIDRVNVNGAESVVGLIDLDGFKPINDTIGHHAGDVVLQTVSKHLQGSLRATDTMSRLGGDEFAFILENVSDRELVERKAQQILDAIATPIHIDGEQVQVTGSIGLAFCPHDDDTAEGIVKAADMAMYEAKNGKGRFVFYCDMPAEEQERAESASQSAQAAATH